MAYKWMPLMGKMVENADSIVFKGGPVNIPEKGQLGSEVGIFICDQVFSEGTISVSVTFKDDSSAPRTAGIIFNFDPQTQNMLVGSLSDAALFTIRQQGKEGWVTYAVGGPLKAIEASRTYHLKIVLRGSLVSLWVDNVEVLRTTLPASPPQSQVGLFCMDYGEIIFEEFLVESDKPKAFVAMQFSSPYNEVYLDVIKGVCDQEKIDVVRIDEASGPGLIVEDIAKIIRESKLIIADISPLNANVYYEVGFAHALNKPTILIAEKGTSLPFDVSPFRTLFYENSIGGKRKLEEGLRKHIIGSLRQPFE